MLVWRVAIGLRLFVFENRKIEISIITGTCARAISAEARGL